MKFELPRMWFAWVTAFHPNIYLFKNLTALILPNIAAVGMVYFAAGLVGFDSRSITSGPFAGCLKYFVTCDTSVVFCFDRIMHLLLRLPNGTPAQATSHVTPEYWVLFYLMFIIRPISLQPYARSPCSACPDMSLLFSLPLHSSRFSFPAALILCHGHHLLFYHDVTVPSAKRIAVHCPIARATGSKNSWLLMVRRLPSFNTAQKKPILAQRYRLSCSRERLSPCIPLTHWRASFRPRLAFQKCRIRTLPTFVHCHDNSAVVYEDIFVLESANTSFRAKHCPFVTEYV